MFRWVLGQAVQFTIRFEQNWQHTVVGEMKTCFTFQSYLFVFIFLFICLFLFLFLSLLSFVCSLCLSLCRFFLSLSLSLSLSFLFSLSVFSLFIFHGRFCKELLIFYTRQNVCRLVILHKQVTRQQKGSTNLALGLISMALLLCCGLFT